MTRRTFLGGAAAMAAAAASPTRFQIGHLTLPWGAYPVERAMEGIVRSGCRHMGFGSRHAGKPTIELEAPPAEMARLADRARGMGLSPDLLFSGVGIEAAGAVDAHLRRIDQAAAGRIPYLLTFGSTKPGQRDVWIANLKQLAPRAQAAGVMLVIKPHGGNTATGKDCAGIVSDVGHPGLKICYDAGNVLDYQDVDPIPDIQTCAAEVYCFCIKDHRDTPKDQDCGPGFGEIDHYKLLMPVARTGLTMPLACENIFEPLVKRPATPEGIDALARRAREFLETVTRGIQL